MLDAFLHRSAAESDEPDWLASLDEDRQAELREVDRYGPRWQSVSGTNELLMQVIRELRRGAG